MNGLNLYIFTRCEKTSDYASFEKHLSRREVSLSQIKEEEISSIKMLTTLLIQNNISMLELDNWFYSFTIPQISKEFDLLLIDKNRKVVNIEIKSQETTEQKIEKQLMQNRYYLSNIADEIMSFTFVRKDENNYDLFFYDNELMKSSMQDLVSCIRKINDPLSEGIEDLFKPNDYLISPINTPDAFVSGNYFLTNQQAEIRRDIVKDIQIKSKLYGLKGSAGTGKSLLVYDLAVEFSKYGPVCVIHSGNLSSGHRYLESILHNVRIIPARLVSRELVENYKYILVDETQRLYRSALDTILTCYNEKTIAVCVFAYDFVQVLSKKEKYRNNPARLRAITGFKEYELSTRIRSNYEIFSFVRNMMILSDRPKKKVDYKNVDVVLANNIEEAKYFKNYYVNKGYKFITLTPSQYVKNEIDQFAGNTNSHEVVGQEFDKVVVILDNNFRYSEEGILQAKQHPNPDYLFANLFYQNITRAREKLAVVIYNNPDMFSKILDIM